MFEFSTVWMQAIESCGFITTEGFDGKTVGDDVNIADVMTVDTDYCLFTSIPSLNDAILIILIVFVGFVLNSIIIRCYWNSKSSTAIYIRAFAAYDLCVLSLAPNFLIDLFFPNMKPFFKILKGILGGFAIIGPLFLALDRFLVVAFPHKFKKYEKSMKIAKGSIFSITLVTKGVAEITAVAIGYDNRMVEIFFFVFRPILAAQFVTCVVLYVIIIVKIVTSERKMAKHRHVANQ